MLLAVTCIFGVMLGLTCNILVFLPVFLAVSGAYAAASIGTDKGLYDLIQEAAFPTLAIQFGYMIGLTGQASLEKIAVKLNMTYSKRI